MDRPAQPPLPRGLARVRTWPVWTLRPALRWYVCTVVGVGAAAVAATAATTDWRPGDGILFGLLLAFGAVTVETLRRIGEPAGSMQTQLGFHTLISWSGLDIGRDRGSPVSHYDAPFEFTGRLLRVTVAMHDDQSLEGDGVGAAEMARQ